MSAISINCTILLFMYSQYSYNLYYACIFIIYIMVMVFIMYIMVMIFIMYIMLILVIGLITEWTQLEMRVILGIRLMHWVTGPCGIL